MKYDKIVAINKEKSKEKTEIAINEIEKMYQRKEMRHYFSKENAITLRKLYLTEPWKKQTTI